MNRKLQNTMFWHENSGVRERITQESLLKTEGSKDLTLFKTKSTRISSMRVTVFIKLDQRTANLCHKHFVSSGITACNVEQNTES